MCGIIGISAENNVAEEIYESLLMLQHRGQDAAGMVVCEPSGKLNLSLIQSDAADDVRCVVSGGGGGG